MQLLFVIHFTYVYTYLSKLHFALLKNCSNLLINFLFFSLLALDVTNIDIQAVEHVSSSVLAYWKFYYLFCFYLYSQKLQY